MQLFSKVLFSSKTMTSSNNANLMAILRVAKEGISYPFGDSRSVKQAFPAGIESVDSDPFLMCDYFDVEEKTGKAKHEDEFPVDWHPHRGFDIATYLRSGTGRHGDSLGNRETFKTPGMQWMSTGSGVVHAEGGANDKGDYVQGFQIWVNVPSEKKMDDPRYGTVPSNDLPTIQLSDGFSTARVLAGVTTATSVTTETCDTSGEAEKQDDQPTSETVAGPFQTVQDVQMIDFDIQPNSHIEFDVTVGLDTAILYIYEGGIKQLNNKSFDGESSIESGNIVLMDATSDDKRRLDIVTRSEGAKVMLFAGKKLKEPIAWHGPIVMNTQDQVKQTIHELRTGAFPPKRVDWDYKRLASKPNA